MYFDVDLNAEPPTVELADPDNFQAFQIAGTGPREKMGAALAPLGRWDGEHGWFDPERVIELAGDHADSEQWRQGFTALRSYAADHGYVAEDGALRAHVEWRD